MLSSILPLAGLGGNLPSIPPPNSGPATQTAINVFGGTGNEPLRDLSSILTAINQPSANGGYVANQRLPVIERASMNWVPIVVIAAIGLILYASRNN
jgi:hypothetical protein